MAAKFQLGDLVKTMRLQNVQYSGRVVEIMEVRLGFAYRVELAQNGLIRTFFETQLELIQKSSQQSASY